MKQKLLLKTMLLLFALIARSTSSWADGPDLSSMVWSTPIVNENFNSATAAMATATKNPGVTNYTAMGEFNCIYNNNTSNKYGIEDNTTLSSKALKLYAGSGSPVIAAISGKSFATKGAYSFKITKASKACIGLYNETISGTALGHAKATAFLQNNAGSLSISSGSAWVSVGSFTSTDVLDICVIYNSTNSAATYGDGVSLAAKTAHIYVNGSCVMNAASPKAFSIPGVAALGFRVYPTTTSGNVAIVDDVKIYDALPTVPAYTITAAVNDADMGSAALTGSATITATPNDGYRVKAGAAGYTVSSGTATVTNNGDNTFSVVPSSDCTITINFEAIPTHKVNVTAPSGGTITIKDGDDVVASGSDVREGKVLTIIAAAGGGKVFDSWSVTGASPASTTTTTTTFTMGDSDVTIAATFNDATTHPIHWSVNGSVIKTDNVVENEDISFDAPVSGVPAGYAFKGWSEATIVTPQAVAPTYVISAKSTAEKTYYAVMAVEIPGKTDELDRALTGISDGGGYGEWSGKTATSDAVYAGNSAGANNAIQLRSKNDESGIITTTSGGNVKKVTITWNSNTVAGRQLDVYGKNSAYSAASDLYGEGKGTLLGSIVKGTSTELLISGDYAYIGLRSNADAMYLDKITIEWGTNVNFCTTVPTATVSINAACTDGEGKYYGTYSNSKAFVVPADLTVSEISVVDSKLAITNYDEGDIVPANTGVMVSSTTSGDHAITLAAGGTSVLGANNMLHPSGDAGIMKADMRMAYPMGTKFYRLTMHNGTQLGFYWGEAGGDAFNLAANKAYLAVPPTTSAPTFFELGGDATGINAVNGSEFMVNGEYYNLAGQRVAQPTKGLYIVNGKKVVIK